MKSWLILVLTVAFMLSGCDVRASLFPVQGPLSLQTPSPVYTAKIKISGRGRDVSVIYNQGEALSGKWEKVPGAGDSKGSATAGGLAADNLSAEWDTVYGSGYYVAHILGKSYGRAVVKGNQGTVLTVEMYGLQVGTLLKGVAIDNLGNVYKVVFH